MSPSRAPEPGGDHAPRLPVACPHCGATDVAVESEFGSSLMTRQFYCRACRTVFEWVKWEDEGSAGDWLKS